VVPALSVPTVVVCEPTSGAVVLGSTQSDSNVDVVTCAAAGLDVLRRRSGGGAVVVRPGAQVWIDVFLPRSDARFSDDVLASFMFLGQAWRSALAATVEAASPPVVISSAETTATTWSAILCFAGRGAGEVMIEGRKVVGISQRRDRSGAWFHSMAMLDFDPFELPLLLGLTGDDQLEAGTFLATAATVVPGGRSVRTALLEAVLSRLS
jgi:lipoate-protein ligase A